MADQLREEMENHAEIDKFNAIERSRQISKIVQDSRTNLK